MLLLAASYLHGLDPFAIRFTDTFGLRWYGLSYAAGFVIAWWMIRAIARRGRSPVPVSAVGDLMFYIIAGVLVGGRLGYVIFYDPSLFIGFSTHVPFWDVLAINRGGMASHGGMIGVSIACLVFARRRSVSVLHLFDLVALTCTPGLFLGRLANFVNGELHGRALPDQMNAPWWSMKFPQELREWPVNRLAEITDTITTALGIDRGEWAHYLATAADNAASRETIAHLVDQLIRASQESVAIRESLRPVLTAYYPSQIIQAVTDGPILLALLALIWWRPRRPGVVGSWFLILYGVMRVATEMVRAPDVGVDPFLGLSRGQVLSVLMILAGAASLAMTARRNVSRIGGLGPIAGG